VNATHNVTMSAGYALPRAAALIICSTCDMSQIWIASIEGWPVLSWLVRVSTKICFWWKKNFLGFCV